MFVNSFDKLIKILLEKINNTQGAFITYILPSKLSKYNFLQKIEEKLPNYLKDFLIKIAVDENFEEIFINHFHNNLKDNFDIQLNLNNKSEFFEKNFIKLIDELNKTNNKNKISYVFLLTYSGNLELRYLYTILSKVRNLREKIVQKNFEKISTYFIFYGSFPFQELIDYCSSLSVSSVIENRIIFNTFSLKDLESFPEVNKDEITLQFIYELTNGCPYLLQKFLSSVPNLNSLKNIFEAYCHIADSDEFNTLIKNIYDGLSDKNKKFINDLLDLRIIKSKNIDEKLESLILSGLVTIKLESDYYLITIRNQAVETSLRKILWKSNNQAPLNDLIPKFIVSNTYCFQIINELELLLKNFLAIYLRKLFIEKDIKEHPLRKIKYGRRNNRSVKSYSNYFEYCVDQRNRLLNNQNLVYNDSLYAYLNFSDMIKVIFDIGIDELGQKPLINYLKHIFNNPEELKGKIETLKQLRDAVAHSNNINIETLDQLIKIRKYIYKKLQIDIGK